MLEQRGIVDREDRSVAVVLGGLETVSSGGFQGLSDRGDATGVFVGRGLPAADDLERRDVFLVDIATDDLHANIIAAG